MLYKFYLLFGTVSLITFAVAQYDGWSWSSEDSGRMHTHTGSGSFSSGSHRGTFHK